MRDNCLFFCRGSPVGAGDWLRSLGLGQYESLLRESERDPEVSPELIDADLEKCGVQLGDRKRLPKAISNLASPGQPMRSGAAS
jgi:hypothetical protein